ncbi:MAG: DUF2062 domain-containing protein [Pseudomonadota bacterium]
MLHQRAQQQTHEASTDREIRDATTSAEEQSQQDRIVNPVPGRSSHSRWWGAVRKYFIEPFVGSTNPPWFDARGIAVGLAVGFGVPVGAQLAFMGLLRAVFRYNTVIAFAFSWVNNPLTMIPMYYGYYYLGSLMLGKPVTLTGETFKRMMAPIVHADHFLQSLHQFMDLGLDILIRWGLTSLILAVTSAVLGYVIGLRVQQAHCRKKAEQMGVAYEKLLAHLEQSAGYGKNRSD